MNLGPAFHDFAVAPAEQPSASASVAPGVGAAAEVSEDSAADDLHMDDARDIREHEDVVEHQWEEWCSAADPDEVVPVGLSSDSDLEPLADEVATAAERRLHESDEDGSGPSNDSELSIDDLVRGCTVSIMGFVACSLPPFSNMNLPRGLAKLNYFPVDRPLAQQSLSIRCYLHPNCSVMIPRRYVEESEILAWICSARQPEGPWDAEECLNEHLSSFAEMKSRFIKRFKPAAQSSASGSRG